MAPEFSLAAIQFLNVLLSKEQVVYHNKGLGLLLRKAEGGPIYLTGPGQLSCRWRGEFALGSFSTQCSLSGEVILCISFRFISFHFISFHCDFLSPNPALALGLALRSFERNMKGTPPSREEKAISTEEVHMKWPGP